jgi:hypothetical protein
VDDDVTQNRGRRAVHVSIDVEVSADNHHRAGCRGAGRDGEVTSRHLCVPSESGKSYAITSLSVRILHGHGRNH